jgi:hypothetical protein
LLITLNIRQVTCFSLKTRRFGKRSTLRSNVQFWKIGLCIHYAIGDVTPGQALAHVASAEGILCVEKIAGLHVEALDYGNIPGCSRRHWKVSA